MTARLRGRNQQDGITVVEMAVVVALLGLVLAMAFQGLLSYQRAAASAETRQRNLEEARTMMAVLAKDLRTATAFTAASPSVGAPTDVTFAGLLNTGATAPPNQLRLYADGGGVLREAVTPPDDPNASPVTYTGTPRTRVVGQGLVSTGTLLSLRTSADAVATSLSTVASLVITVTVDLPSASGAEVPATVLSSRVFLPNVAAASEE
jgi:type II secretory pathway pseudopilin PulG